MNANNTGTPVTGPVHSRTPARLARKKVGVGPLTDPLASFYGPQALALQTGRRSGQCKGQLGGWNAEPDFWRSERMECA